MSELSLWHGVVMLSDNLELATMQQVIPCTLLRCTSLH